MRAAIGSQCKLMNRGVICVLFGSLKINLAAAFWINCRGLMEWLEDLPREHYNSQVWTEQELEQGVVLHVPKERALIFLILYKANLQERAVFSNVV